MISILKSWINKRFYVSIDPSDIEEFWPKNCLTKAILILFNHLLTTAVLFLFEYLECSSPLCIRLGGTYKDILQTFQHNGLKGSILKFSCLSIFRLSNLSCTISLGNGGEAFLIYLATLQFHNNFDSKVFLMHTIFHNTNDCLYMAQSHFLIQYWHFSGRTDHQIHYKGFREHIQHYCTDKRKRACISV